jgi:hypothetical protein
VRYFQGQREAALMGLAQNVAGAYSLLAGLSYNILHAHISGPHGRERGFFRKVMFFAAGYYTALLAAALLGTYVLLALVLDERYLAALAPTCLALGAAWLGVLGLPATMYLIVRGLERPTGWIYGAGAVLFAAAGSVLAWQWGAAGCAGGMIVANAGVCGMLYLAERHPRAKPNRMAGV